MQIIENVDDRDKFEQLYLKFQGLMYHSAISILHNNEDAEDVVHLAFVFNIENLGKSEQ